MDEPRRAFEFTSSQWPSSQRDPLGAAPVSRREPAPPPEPDPLQWFSGARQPVPARRRLPWRHLAGYPAAIVLALGIGYAAASPAASPRTAVTSSASAAAGRDESLKPAAAQGRKLPDGVYRFGRTVTFDDGSTIAVSKAQVFTRSAYAAGGEKARAAVKFRLTFVNNSSTVFDPALTTVRVSSGDAEADAIFQDGLDTPANKLLPGKRVTWWSGFGVANPKRATLTVNIGFLDYQDVIFTNEA